MSHKNFSIIALEVTAKYLSLAQFTNMLVIEMLNLNS